MRLFMYALLMSALFVSLYEAKDLTVGNRMNNVLVSTEKVFYHALPLLKRDADYTYKDPARRIIKGIIARDLSRTATVPVITDGGVGFSRVTIHFQSERGDGLNYLVLIFTKTA